MLRGACSEHFILYSGGPWDRSADEITKVRFAIIESARKIARLKLIKDSSNS
jgi:hypothetical protein